MPRAFLSAVYGCVHNTHSTPLHIHAHREREKLVHVRRKSLLLKYIVLPPPPPPPPFFVLFLFLLFFFYFFYISKFNFSQTVGEMVFVSFEVEKMRMFLVQSVVQYCVLVRSWGAGVSFSHTGMEELPFLFCYKFFFYSKFWATDAVFLKV